MTPSNLKTALSLALNHIDEDFISQESDSFIFWYNFLRKLNEISPIKGFKIGINTGEDFHLLDIISNIHIISFHDDDESHLTNEVKEQIIKTTNEELDEGYLDCTFLAEHLIINADY